VKLNKLMYLKYLGLLLWNLLH